MQNSIPQITYIEKPLVREPWKIQFSIKSMVIAMTLVGFVVGALAAPGVFALVAVIAFVLMTPMLLLAAVFGRGWIQAFSIGALVPHLFTYIASRAILRGPEDVLISFGISVGAMVCFGLATACAHGFLKRHGRKVPVPNIPILRDLLSND